MVTVKERILAFVAKKGLKMKEFERMAQLSTGYVTSMRKGFGSEKLNNVLEAFPDLNREWLLYGEGEMLKNSSVPISGGELVASDAESFAQASAKYGSTLVPEYNADFRGGNRGALLDSESIIGYWLIPNAPKGAFIVTMYGTSMMPEIQSGARLLLAPMSFDKQYPNSIPFGRIFGVVVASDDVGSPMAHIKILRRHYDRALESKFWIARSVNRESFDDFDIPIERVTHLYKVLSSITNTWGL